MITNSLAGVVGVHHGDTAGATRRVWEGSISRGAFHRTRPELRDLRDDRVRCHAVASDWVAGGGPRGEAI